jgi:trigger factor
LEELRASLEARYQKEAEEKTKLNQQEALLAELLKYVEVDLPETLIEKEIDAMLTQTAMRLSQQGVDVKKLFTEDIIPQLRERSREEAIERLKSSLGLKEVGKRESIKVTPEEVQTRVAELMEQYEDQDIDADKMRSYVENEMLTQKIVDWLLEHSSVELVPEGSLSPAAETAEESQTTEPQTEAENAAPSTESI